MDPVGLGKHLKSHGIETRDHIYTNYVCDASVGVNDMVYVDSSGILQKAIANSADSARIIGAVVEKPGPAEARVKYIGLIFDFTGLAPGRQYFLSHDNAGLISDTIPVDPGHVVKYCGTATDATTLFLDPTRTLVVLS